MNADPNAPSNGVPPRQFEPWTRVDGHVLTGWDRGRGLCACGARQAPLAQGATDREARDAGLEWRRDHLENAWPVLVPRLDGESLQDWLGRVSDELGKARQVEEEIGRRLGMNRPIGPGGDYPLMTDEYSAAGEVVEVLQHQIDEIRERLFKHGVWDRPESLD